MEGKSSILSATGLALMLVATPLVAGQQSQNHAVEGATIYGGIAASSVELSSTQFRISFSTMGEPLASETTAVGDGHSAQSGFVSAYSPPSEVTALAFADSETLTWQAARSGLSYVLYRGSLAGLPYAYGSCLETGIPTTTTADPATPSGGETFVYLVAARNLLDEESGTGTDSAQTPRTPTACP